MTFSIQKCRREFYPFWESPPLWRENIGFLGPMREPQFRAINDELSRRKVSIDPWLPETDKFVYTREYLIWHSLP